MTRIISERKVDQESHHEDILDHDQECRRRNGVIRSYVPIDQVPDPNNHWFRHDSDGKLLHVLVNPA